jgi:TolA-binding protein
MLQLKRDSAPYSELDFPQFNPKGFVRVRQAVEVAQQARALAQTPEELRDATTALRAANDIKNAEQQVAQKNFETEREKAFATLASAQTRFSNARLSAPKCLEIENRLDNLITLFNLKDFDAVHREIPAMLNMMKSGPYRPNQERHTFKRADRSVPPPPQSISSLFRHGQTLERMGRAREAVEVYGQVLRQNPSHFQAINRLRQIGNVTTEQREENKTRRLSCTRRYKRYAS